MNGTNRVQAWITSFGRRFQDRAAAGRALAARLNAYAARPDTLVLALPRGGVPVAFEVARAIGAPLELILVRKLGVPGDEELALGALAEGGAQVLNTDLVRGLRIGPDLIAKVAAGAAREIARQAHAYRGDHLAPDLAGRTVILVDDGLATGATMRAAIVAARAQAPARLIAAAPVAAHEAVDLLRPLVDELVIAEAPETCGAVGLWYEDFAPVSDDEVRALLQRAAELYAGSAGAHA